MSIVATSSRLDGWWPLVNFIFGLIFGAAALWGFLEWREYKNQNEGDDDEDQYGT